MNLENCLIKGIAVIGAIDNSLREGMLREPNLTYEKAIALGQSIEQNYCPSEREKLAIVFACSKFNEYRYDKKFILQSDHKPLTSILNTLIHKAPPRIQQFIMFLQKYDFVIN